MTTLTITHIAHPSVGVFAYPSETVYTVSEGYAKTPYLKQRRENGHVLPKAIPGRPAKKERCCRPTCSRN